MNISVIVPLLNEAESLPELTSWIERVMNENHFSYEVLMIDDGSTDDSWKIIEELNAKNPALRGIKFRRNYGKSAALNVGFEACSGDTTESVSPSSPSYDDSWWYRISLPYDCAVDVPFDQFANTVGWYRHHFTLAEWEKGRNVAIRFDGISGRREVYCNGVLLGHGTEAFPTDVYDLTPYLNYGSDNLIAVKVSALAARRLSVFTKISLVHEVSASCRTSITAFSKGITQWYESPPPSSA